jgi:hypothetical protein
MEQNDFLEKTGRSILKRMHQHYIKEVLDDTEFIPFVKAVMQGWKINWPPSTAQRTKETICAGH